MRGCRYCRGMAVIGSFPADALEMNRVGDLTEAQRRGLGALSGYRRRNELTIAAFLLAGASIVWFLASPTAPLLKRELIAGGAAVLAAFFVVRSITGGDALTRDLRESRVESVEGAIGKRRVSGGRARSTYFLDVGDRTFKVAMATYQAAPDAGWVRAYYLPLSRKVVNLELLPNTSAAPDPTPKGMMDALRTSLTGDRREANEARAGIAKLGESLKAPFEGSAQPPPPEARDQRPLAEAILGTWKNPLVSVTFAEGGVATVRLFTGEKTGHWSVDASGRLRGAFMGREETIEAWVAGDTLTVVAQGRTLTFTRESR
jgi:hypothetical protein